MAEAEVPMQDTEAEEEEVEEVEEVDQPNHMDTPSSTTNDDEVYEGDSN